MEGFKEVLYLAFKFFIRPLNEGKNLLKLNLSNIQSYSLKGIENLSNPIKYAKKFIKKLINLFKGKLLLTFLNDNFDLFVLPNENENENNNLINKELITGLIDIVFRHFKEIYKANN